MILGLALLGACAGEGTAPTEGEPAAPMVVVPDVLPAARPPGPAPAAPPDLVLVTVESLRADHLTLYGYPRETAPWITALGGRGVVFERAYATASWEAPALASLLTGLYPNQHNVDRGAPDGDAVEGQPALPSAIQTLAERLGAAGYHTQAVSASLHASKALGFAQGFDRFVDLGFQDHASAVEAAVAQLDPLQGPRFTWLHLRDPRGPYERREPWFERYAAEPTPLTLLDQRAPEPDRAARQAGLEAEIAAYDSELSATDDALSRLLQALDPRGDAVVVLVGTTGEELRDQGRLGRRATLAEPVVRVPLVVAAPGLAAGRWASPVSQVDVLPTLLELSTGQAPSDVAGHSLLGAMRGEAAAPRALPMTLRATETRSLNGLLVGDWKLVRVEDLNTTYGTHLYNLADDPGETSDLAATATAERGALSAALDRWLADAPSTPPGPIQRVEPR